MTVPVQYVCSYLFFLFETYIYLRLTYVYSYLNLFNYTFSHEILSLFSLDATCFTYFFHHIDLTPQNISKNL